MKIILGLGNIGFEYRNTRHNIGFMSVDSYAKKHNIEFQSSKFHADIAKFKVNDEQVVLMKPTTYMNRSGIALQAILNFYKADLNDVLVLVDDMDMALGKMRFRNQGSAGGHNGLKSIMHETGRKDFLRLKFGIGHPQKGPNAVVDYVLGDFKEDEVETVKAMLTKSVSAIEDFIDDVDAQKLANKYNG